MGKFTLETLILVVDDARSTRTMVTIGCKKAGFKNFIEAVNGADALVKLRESPVPVGLIISDWMMPEMTGLDFLKVVRADEKFKTLPFVMVTAEADESSIKLAQEAGCSYFIIKPFTADKLREGLLTVVKAALK